MKLKKLFSTIIIGLGLALFVLLALNRPTLAHPPAPPTTPLEGVSPPNTVAPAQASLLSAATYSDTLAPHPTHSLTDVNKHNDQEANAEENIFAGQDTVPSPTRPQEDELLLPSENPNAPDGAGQLEQKPGALPNDEELVARNAISRADLIALDDEELAALLEARQGEEAAPTQPPAPLAAAPPRPILATLTVGGACGATIQACITAASAGDTILIPAGTYNESVTLNKAVSLIGADSATTIIQAPASQRVMLVTGATITQSVVISGLTLTGGNRTGGTTCPTYCGGGIYLTGSAQPLLHSLVITGNQAGRSGGGLYAGSGSSLNLTNVTFINNTATTNGGGAYAFWPTVISGGHFENNRCTASYCYGGGLVAWNTLTMTDTDFINNTATYDGGGADLEGPSVISGGRFENNRCTASSCYGGGLAAYNTLTLTDTDFISNSATYEGGGVYAVATATLTGGSFEDNAATYGGGLYAFDTLTLVGTDFISNTAITSGGGVYAKQAAVVNRVYFEDNTATYGGGLYAESTLTLVDTSLTGNTATATGGGVDVEQSAVITGGHFEDNAANWGGGLYAEGTTTITGGHFEENVANWGGGLDAEGTLTLTDTDFISNTATDGWGGGVYAYSVTTITWGHFEGNACINIDCFGGGLHAENELTLTNTIFLSNTAAYVGGGAYAGQLAIVTGGRFEQNRCASTMSSDCFGGGLAIENDLILVDTFFISNTSKLYGGGLVGNIYSNLSLTNPTFIGNTAAEEGGGIEAMGAATINYGYFADNHCTGVDCDGGGLGVFDNLIVTDTVFLSNTATLHGGGVYVEGTALVNGGRFENNRTTQNDGTGGGLFVAGNVTVNNGYFTHNSAFNGAGMMLDGTSAVTNSDGRIVNTLFSDNSARRSGASVAFGKGSQQITILHTTIADTTMNLQAAIHLISGTVSIIDSIILNHATGIKQETAGSVVEDYNLYFNVTTPVFGNVTQGGHSLTGDPKFLNPAGGDYRLSPDSAAIDTGIDVGIDVDLDGAVRPQGSGFDMGAYEMLPLPNLLLSKSATPTLILPGQTVTYTLIVTNNGTAPATTGQLLDTLPPGLSVTGPMTITPTTAGQPDTLPILADDLTIPAGEEITVTFAATLSSSLSAGTLLTNTATITSAEVTTPTTATATITVGATPPLPVDGWVVYLPIVMKN